MTSAQIARYREIYSDLKRVSLQLEDHIADILAESQHIDRISARAKEPDSFAAKAARGDQDGNSKYPSPLDQIQDQLAARVVVFYRKDVKVIGDRLERYFRHIEQEDIVPDSEWEFGYFGSHWVFLLPRDVIPEDVDVDDVPSFFELQVKTLFQHAWSEANHDLGYKAPADLTRDQKRRFAYTSAQAWGADRVFDELHGEIATEE